MYPKKKRQKSGTHRPQNGLSRTPFQRSQGQGARPVFSRSVVTASAPLEGVPSPHAFRGAALAWQNA